MKTRHKRMAFILVGLAGLGVAAWLVLNALNSNLALYISPTDVLAGDAPKNQTFRLGGLVVEESLEREDDGLTVHFKVTDSANTIPVTFTGILPDLFEEGQGVVAQGKMQGGVFIASEVLAKHDENYMPTQVADMLEEGEKLNQQEQAGGSATVVPQTP